MKRILSLLFALTFVSCSDPTQHDQARFGTITVWIAPGWLSLDKADITQELGNLNHLGPSFVEAGDPYTADVVVYPWISPNCRTSGAGRWIVGTRRVEVDRVCETSAVAFRAAIGHEIGHALGMQHICENQELAVCSPVGQGRAMMNPSLFEGDEIIDLPQSSDIPTQLDLDEFLRVRSTVLDASVMSD
jgi:hypothetical protein